ncbi:MAG TPA: hypothetical protein VFD92_06010 [Candidatus Binatia bacterium]|nr:hypothetical protein [Candidatus Binatia bacterium]
MLPRRVLRSAVALAALFALACGDAHVAPPPATATARFEPSLGAPMAWGDVPFPSDLYRDESGRIRIGAVPTALSDAPFWVAMRDVFATRDGFCATCNAYFAIDGDLDVGQLAEEGGVLDADAIVIADVDPASPERGRRFSLRVQWDAATHLLAVRPARGIALHRARRYAVALTTALRAVDGTALGASDAFRRALGSRSEDPAIERARALMAPALAELDRIGIPRDDVVALAPFTTEDVTADVLAARAAVQTGPPLAVRIDRVRRGAELDELLGVPSEDRPGIDVPPVQGTAGTRSIVHRSIAAAVTGEIEAARIVEGTGTGIGVLRRDPAGAIAAGPREPVPFVLTIPTGGDLARLPVAIAHHGFNASRVTGFASAETAARAGVAVLAIDAFQHGERAASARDQVNSIRGGIPGPDGFAETEPLDVSARVFGVLGAAPGLEGFPGYSVGTLLQFGADVASTARAVREGELSRAVGAALSEPIALDPTRVGFIGNSLGAVVGASALVAEPTLRAGVQNVQPGSIVETLVESPEFRPLVEVVFLPRLGVTGEFDEVERHLILDPLVDLSRWVIEPADPLALAPYLVRDPVRPGGPAEILFQIASLDEVAATLATASMIEASAAPRVTRYDPAAHGMLEVLDQSSRYEPPAIPPFRVRPEPLAIANPLVAEHAEIEAFLRAFLVDAPAP